MVMFHVERFLKPFLLKGFFVFFAGLMFTSCITPRHTVEINDYVLLLDGKELLGHDKGLTAFVFENNQKKMPFQQFLMTKYHLGPTEELNYYVNVENIRFKVFLYTNDELNKYFDTSQFMVSNFETEVNRVGSSANFLAVSVINDNNEDCLAEGSLFQSIAVKYLKDLKYEYYNY